MISSMTVSAGKYLRGHHDSVLRSHRWRTAGNSAAYLVGSLRTGMSVLDVGCGPGTITADLRELASAWHRWAASTDGWFMAPHGEILCRA